MVKTGTILGLGYVKAGRWILTVLGKVITVFTGNRSKARGN